MSRVQHVLVEVSCFISFLWYCLLAGEDDAAAVYSAQSWGCNHITKNPKLDIIGIAFNTFEHSSIL